MSSNAAVAIPVTAAPAATAGPSMLIGAPVAATWTPWMMRLERLVYQACATSRRQARRARQLTVVVRLDSGAKVTRTVDLPRPTDHGADAMPAALGLLRLLMDEHDGHVTRLGVSLTGMVEAADQPIRFERYQARRRQAKLMKLASLLGCFGALGGLFTLR